MDFRTKVAPGPKKPAPYRQPNHQPITTKYSI